MGLISIGSAISSVCSFVGRICSSIAGALGGTVLGQGDGEDIRHHDGVSSAEQPLPERRCKGKHPEPGGEREQAVREAHREG